MSRYYILYVLAVPPPVAHTFNIVFVEKYQDVF